MYCNLNRKGKEKGKRNRSGRGSERDTGRKSYGKQKRRERSERGGKE